MHMARAWLVHAAHGMCIAMCVAMCIARCMECTACTPETNAAIGAPWRVERDKGAKQAVLCCRQLVGGTEEARGELTHEDIAPRLGGQNAKRSATLALL